MYLDILTCPIWEYDVYSKLGVPQKHIHFKLIMYNGFRYILSDYDMLDWQKIPIEFKEWYQYSWILEHSWILREFMLYLIPADTRIKNYFKFLKPKTTWDH